MVVDLFLLLIWQSEKQSTTTYRALCCCWNFHPLTAALSAWTDVLEKPKLPSLVLRGVTQHLPTTISTTEDGVSFPWSIKYFRCNSDVCSALSRTTLWTTRLPVSIVGRFSLSISQCKKQATTIYRVLCCCWNLCPLTAGLGDWSNVLEKKRLNGAYPFDRD